MSNLPNTPSSPVYLSIQDAASRLGVSIETLRRWDKSGVLVPVRTVGNQRRYTLEQVENFTKRKWKRVVTPPANGQQPLPQQNGQSTVVSAPVPNPIQTPEQGVPVGQVTPPSDPGALKESLEKGGLAGNDQPTPQVVEPAAPMPLDAQGLKPVYVSALGKYVVPKAQQKPVQELVVPVGQKTVTYPIKDDRKGSFTSFISDHKGVTSGIGASLFVFLIVLGLVSLDLDAVPGLSALQRQLGLSRGGSEGVQAQVGNATGIPPAVAGSQNIIFRVNVPSQFADIDIQGPLSVQSDAVFNSGLTANGGIITNNADINAGTGVVIASNIPDVIISGVTAGTGISVTGDANPTIANSGVLSFQGQTGAVTLSAGTGISISGTTISSSITTDAGSAQNIFKQIAVSGEDTIEATNNNDILEFAAGAGITLTTDAGNKLITIGTAGGAVSQWTSAGSDIYFTGGNVGIGLTNPTAALDVTGSIHFGGLSSGVVINSSGTLSSEAQLNIARGGTGIGTSPSNGQLLIGNGSGYTLANLTQGSGMTITNGAGSISLATTLGTSVDLTSEITATLGVGNGGTNATSIGSAGSIAYSTGTAYAFSAVGGAGQVLVSGASGAPTWSDVSGLAGINYWDQANGTLYPKFASVNDLLIGGNSTASAKFAFINVGSGTPTASIAGNLTFAGGARTISSTAFNTLAIGDSQTGDVLLSPGTGKEVRFFSGSNRIDSSGNLTLGGDIFISNGNFVGLSGAAGRLEFTDATPDEIEVQSANLDLNSNIAINIGNSGTDFTSTGGLTLAGDFTSNANTVLGDADTDTLVIASSIGNVSFSHSSAQNCTLKTNGSGVLQCGIDNTSAGGGGSNWTVSPTGVIYPSITSLDLLLGGAATSSARFAVTNMLGAGTPTASLSAGTNSGAFLTASGTLATRANQTLTLGDSQTGSINFYTGNNRLTSTGDLTLSGDVILSGGNFLGLSGAGRLEFTDAGTDEVEVMSAVLDLNNNLITNIGDANTDFTSGGGLTLAGAFVANGNMTLGNQDTDTLSIGSAVGNISFAHSSVQNCTLKTNGSGVLQCGTDNIGTGDGGSNWTVAGTGVIYPSITSLDLLLGGTATSSARFAVTNMVGAGTPTASLSAGVAGGAYLDATGRLVTTARQTLTLGDASTTGNINFYSSANRIDSSGNLTLAGNLDINGVGTHDIAGTLNLSGNALTSTGTLAINGADAQDVNIGNNDLFVETSGGNIGLGTITPNEKLDIAGNATASGNLTLSGAARSIQTTAGNTLTLGGGGTGDLVLDSGGNIRFADLATCTALETVNGLLTCGTDDLGTGDGGSNWTVNPNGVIYPSITSLDLLLGGTATSSARFAVTNMVGAGTPTASLSAGVTGGAYLNATGTLATTVNQTLTIGAAGTGNINLAPNGSTAMTLLGNGNVGIGTTTPGALVSLGSSTGNTKLALYEFAGESLGIGVQANEFRLHLGNSGNRFSFWDDAIGSNELFTILGTGNVGIGTNTPRAKLDVAGAASASGNLTFYGGARNIETTARNTLTIGSGGTGDLVLDSGNNIMLADFATCTALETVAGVLTCGSDAGEGGAVNYWQLNSNVLAPGNSANVSDRLVLGGNTSTVHQFEVNGFRTGKALVSLNETGDQAVFTASASGTTVFNIAHSGQLTLASSLYNGSCTALETNASGQVICGVDNIGTGDGTSNWSVGANGVIYPSITSLDLLLGGTSTSSAKFAFINNVGNGAPTASIAGNLALAVPTGSNPSATLNMLNGGSLNFQTSAGGDAGATSRLYLANAGNIGVGTTTPLARLDIKNSGSVSSAGSEKITSSNDRDFTTSTGNWTGTGWSVDVNNSNVAAKDTPGANAITLNNSALDAAASSGNIYQVAFTTTTTGSSSGSIRPSFGGVNGQAIAQKPSTTINEEQVIEATGTGAFILTPTTGWYGTIDNISIKLLSTNNIAFRIESADGVSTPLEIRTGTTGDSHVYIGYNSGRVANDNGAAWGNTAVGSNTLASNTSGGELSAFGAYALNSNTYGYGNSAFGSNALARNTSGDFNTALGIYSMLDMRTGARNTAAGYGSLQDNTAGSFNAAFGNLALNNVATGSGNTAFGTSSLFGLTTGDNNIALGFLAGDSFTTGSNNIVIGYDVDLPNNVGDNQLNIGNIIYGTNIDGRDSTVSTGNIGIGTTAPVEKLDIAGNATASGNLTLSGAARSIQTTAGNTLTLGGGGTGDLVLDSGGNIRFADAGYASCTLKTVAGLLTCGTDNTGSGDGGSNWTVAGTGVIYPSITSLDLLLGGTATSSARFAVTNMVGAGTPTASLSAGVTGGAYLTASGELATTNKQTLTIGGANSGRLVLKSEGTTVFQILGDSGSENIFIGKNAGTLDLESTKNIIIGINAGDAMDNGLDNVIIGADAATDMTNGIENVIIGSQAGHDLTTGDLNTFIGTYAGFNTMSGTSNTFIGQTAGYLNDTGSFNTALGRFAGRNNVSGSNNVFLGYSAGYNETGSNKLYIANSDTLHPLIYGDFAASAMGVSTSAVGNAALVVNQQKAAGDIFSASSSGATRFTIANDGRLTLASSIYNASCTALETNASGQVICGTDDQGSGDGSSNWTLSTANGTLSPNNNTLDILVGGTATSSAKFGILNVAGGTPTASLSAGTNSGAFLTAAGTFATRANQTLTLGDSQTGDVLLSPGSGKQVQFFSSSNRIDSSGNLTVAGDVTVASTNFVGLGSGAGRFEFTDAGTDEIDVQNAVLDLNGNLITDIGNAGTDFTSGGGLTLAGNLVVNGNTTLGNANGDTVSIASSVSNISFSDSSLATCTLKTSGGVLQCGTDNIGTGDGGSNWTVGSNGVIYPSITSLDLLVGGISTSSAKFAFINNIGSGTPTASIAGNITLAGAAGTPAVVQSLNGNRINFKVSAGGDSGTWYPNDTPFFDPDFFFQGRRENGVNDAVEISLRNSNSNSELNFSVGDSSTHNYIRASVGDILLYGNGGGAEVLRVGAASVVFNETGAAYNFRMEGDNNANLFYLNGTTDRIGIGTTTPLALLDIAGDASASGDLTLYGGARTIASSARNTLTVGGGGTGDLIIDSGGNIRFADLGTCTALETINGLLTCGSDDVTAGGGDGGSNWTVSSNGVIYPSITSLDFLLGGTATSSAKFAVTNMVGAGTPTASLSAGVAGGAYLTATGTLATTNRQNLVLGDSTTTGNILLNRAGNVGIGTTNPGYVLDISAPTASMARIASTNNDANLILQGDFGYGGIITFRDTTDRYLVGTDINGAGNLTFKPGSGSEITMIMDSNRNVGIGTTSPIGKLNVNGAAAGRALLVLNETGDQNILTASASGVTMFTLTRTGDLSIEGALSDISGDLSLNDNTNISGNLDVSGTLTSGTTNAFQVDATGNISTSGTTGLTFSNTGSIALAGGSISDTSDGVDIADDLEIAGNTTFGDAVTDTLTFTARVAQDSSLIPVGTTGTNDLGALALPWDTLYVNSIVMTGAGPSGFWQRTGGALSPTNITDALVLGATATSSAVVHLSGTAGQNSFFNGGNVGIGTTTPGAKLAVAGGNFLQTITSGSLTEVGTIKDGVGATLLDTASDVYVSGKYAYVTAETEDALSVIDISNPASPVEVGTIKDGVGATQMEDAEQVAVSGRYAYVTALTDDSLSVIDISDPKNPREVGTIKDGVGATGLNGAHGVFISGRYAYVTGLIDNTLAIIDISDPTNPREVGTIKDGVGATQLSFPYNVYVSGRYAYVVSAIDNALSVIDISNPANPTEVGTIKDGVGATQLNGAISVYVSGKYAYVVSFADDALSIIDISNPSSPTEVGTIKDGVGGTNLNSVQDVYVSGKYAYATSNLDNALTVIDVSTPSSPVEVDAILDGAGATELFGARNVYVSGKYAYVTGYTDDSLSVISIPGIDAPAATIGNLAAGVLNVTDNANIANILNVGTGLNVGFGGIFSNGAITLQSTTSAQLKVEGTQVGQALAIFNQTGGNDIFAASSSGTTRFVIDNSGNASMSGTLTLGNGQAIRSAYGDLNFAYKSAPNTWATGMTLEDLSGNIGIGTTAPTAKLHLSRSGGTTAMQIQSDAGQFASLTFMSGTANRWAWFKSSATESGGNAGSDLLIASYDDAGTLLANPFTIIRSTGNVGIGTTTPSEKLDVAGNATMSGSLTVGNGQAIRSAYGDLNFAYKSAPNTWTTAMTINDLDGNIGIGTTTPSFKLAVAGSIGPSSDDTYDLGSDLRRWKDLYLGPDTLHIGTSTTDEYAISYNTSSNYLGFNVNGSGNPEFVFDSNGNMGIGTTAPVGKLNLSGTNVGKALAIFNETGTNDIFTASSSGVTKFRILNDGSVAFHPTNSGVAMRYDSGIVFENLYPGATTDIAVENSQGTVDSDGGAVGLSNFTVGSNADRILIVGITHENTTISAATYGSQDLTLIEQQTSGGTTTSIYYLVAPSVGTANVSFTTNGGGTARAAIGAVSLYNVSQSSPFGATGESASNSVIMTTVADDMVIDAVGYSAGAASPGASQTEWVDERQNSSGLAMSTETATGTSTTMSWTASGAYVTAVVLKKTSQFTDSLKITESGNIGIGTSAPAGKLNLVGTGNQKALVQIAGDGHQDLFTASASGVTKFLIDKTGNVGVGTTNADYLMTLGNGTSTGTSYIAFRDSDIAHGITTIAPTDVIFEAEAIHPNNGGVRLGGFTTSTTLNGMILRGVSASDPDDTVAALELVGAKASGTGLTTLGSSESVIQFKNNSTVMATFLGSGNLGIGTTTPAGKFSVSGTTNQKALVQIAGDGTQELFTASVSGVAKFTIAKNGDLVLGGADSGTVNDAVIRGAVKSSGTGSDLYIDASNGPTNSGNLFFRTASTANLPVVEFDSAAGTSTSSQPMNLSVTVGNNQNRILLVGLSADNVPTSVTYNGDPLTLISSASNNSETYLYYMVAPDIGTANVAVDVTTSGVVYAVGAVSLYNVDQTNPLGTAQTSNSSHSVSVTTETGDMVVDAAGWRTGALDPDASQTERVEQAGNDNGLRLGMSTESATGASTSMTWGGAPTWQRIIAVPVKRAGATVPTLQARMTIDAQGNVGIGTSTPVGKLNLTGAVTGKALAIFNETGNQDIFTASASGATRFTVTRNGTLQLINDAAINWRNPAGSAYLEGFRYGADNYFHLANSIININGDFGQTGIGTTAPDAQLHVTRPLSYTASGKALAIFNQIENQDILTASAGGTTRFVIDNSGNASISGTLTVGNGQAIRSAFGDLNLAYKSAPNTWTTGMTLEDLSGNVGIGTTAPLFGLHVADAPTNTATAAAMIENTLNNATADVLALKLGVAQASVGTACNNAGGNCNEFITFMDANGRKLGKIHANATNPTITYKVNGLDFGELFVKENPDEKMPEGTLLCLGNDQKVTGCATNGANFILGALSERSGFVGGEEADNAVTVGMLGQLPIRVTLENGPIKKGDPITVSSQKGLGAKAVRPGRILGYAMEDYGTRADGRVWSYISPTWHDPNAFITSTGDVQIAQDGMQKYILTRESETLKTQTGIYEDAIIANMTGGKIKTQELEVSESIFVRGKSLEDIVTEIVDRIVGDRLAEQAEEETPVATSSGTLAQMNDEQLKEYSMKISELVTRVEDLEKFTENIASDTAFLKTIAEGAVLGASASGGLNGSSADDFTVENDLMVLGRATVSDLGVTGVITSGLLQINGIEGEINTIGTPLKLQSLGMADIELQGGKVKFDTRGNVSVEGKITATEVETKKVTTEKINLSEPEEEADSGVLSTSAGTVVLKAGERQLVVRTSALTDKSLIFITPDEPVAVGSKKRSDTEFVITINQPHTRDININWWIVN